MNNTMFHQMALSNAHLTAIRVAILLTMFLLPGCGQDDNQPTSEGTTKTQADLIKAAEQGDAVAQFNLGVMYYGGEGVPQDYEEALRWYKLAAEQGYAVAQGNLGSSYSKGEGVTQDYVLAHMWYNLATSQLSGEDRETAVRNRDIIAEKMISEQLAEARRLAREWEPKSSGHE